MSFDFLTADDFRGFIWGSFPRPLFAIYSLPLLPKPTPHPKAPEAPQRTRIRNSTNSISLTYPHLPQLTRC